MPTHSAPTLHCIAYQQNMQTLANRPSSKLPELQHVKNETSSEQEQFVNLLDECIMLHVRVYSSAIADTGCIILHLYSLM